MNQPLKNKKNPPKQTTTKQEDKTFQKIYIYAVALVLPILFVLLSIRNVRKLSIYNILLISIVITQSIVILCSQVGICMFNLIKVKNSQCKHNSKFALISIGVGVATIIGIFLIMKIKGLLF